MRPIAVVARREFTDDAGVPHAIGECFDVSPVEAVKMLNRGHARFAPRAQRIQTAVIAEEPRKRRTYRRRDLTAESPDV